MSNVTKFEEHLPHVRISTDDGNEHVIPISVFEKIADGRMSLLELDNWYSIIRVVVREWALNLMEETP